MEALTWKKSTRSGTNGGDCVEYAQTPSVILVRDSKDATGPVLTFASGVWRDFVDAVKAGEIHAKL